MHLRHEINICSKYSLEILHKPKTDNCFIVFYDTVMQFFSNLYTLTFNGVDLIIVAMKTKNPEIVIAVQIHTKRWNLCSQNTPNYSCNLVTCFLNTDPAFLYPGLTKTQNLKAQPNTISMFNPGLHYLRFYAQIIETLPI